MKIVTLVTCFNRKNKTLSALSKLHNQILPSNVEMQHVVVDDGSTDGTTEAVVSSFPNVVILKGTGNLFWAGGMRLGWSEYIKKINFDYILLYNDDVVFKNDAILKLINESTLFKADGGCKEHIVVGSFHSGDNLSTTTYGGLIRSSYWHPLRFKIIDPPVDKYILVDTLNMNACLATHELTKEVGFLSEYFIHCGADTEYGLKVRRAGGKIILAKGYFGECERNTIVDDFISTSKNLHDCYKTLLGNKQQPIRERFKYFKNYAGSFWLFLFIAPYLILPAKYAWIKFLKTINRQYIK
jgi:GT2 family glycosyltransferase